MNVSVIYGTTKKACTYNCVQLLLNNLKLTTPITVKEFFLEKKISSNSDIFFSCYVNGDFIYLKSNSIDYLTASVDKSDLIILASPVIQCDITAELKSLLNYLFYKPDEYNRKTFMNAKIGLVMSTAAGAGLPHTVNNLKKNLFFLGINNIFRFGETIYEMNWEDIDLKTKLRINKRIFKLSNKILNKYATFHSANGTVLNKIIPYVFKPNFKNRHTNVIPINLKKNREYAHITRKIH
ncbi:NAD(P)H-dependent oxidoreductase [Clostridium sp. C2-6-12]|uniref:NAD(P)H-dependent oxidoreductase n=1 Tax=Clostridium sp. C2-6-12 TaxID=2698832 RepID=UPI00136B237A|nr:NAD(P)H-dependent oxidoreductase [Clostridium sp. C2-6-12]